MVSSPAKTVTEYLKSLPADRAKAIRAVRKEIKARLPKGYKETMQYGMICYIVPEKVYPDTYNGQPLCIASLGSQKNYMAVYLLNVYGDPALDKWFRESYRKAGLKLDMGKSCVRFKTLEDLPVKLIGEAVSKTSVQDLISQHEKVRRKK